MSQAKSSTQVLKAVKWILENVGWRKGSSFSWDEEGKLDSFCLGGAIFIVDATPEAKNGARRRLANCLPPNMPIFLFNDNTKTTKEDVIELIEKALRKGSK